MRRLGPPWVLAFLAAHLAALIWLGRGLVNEDWDGIKTINNAVLVAGARDTGIGFDGKRPPAGWLLVSPVLGAAYRRAGAAGALAACRWAMPCFLTLLLYFSHRRFARSFSPAAAGALLALMACNPILLQFAPFAAVDIFAGLAVLAFLAAAAAFVERSDRRRWAALAAASVFLFLSKYHLGILLAAPAVLLLLEGRSKDALAVAALAPLAWLAALAALSGLIAWTTRGSPGALSAAWSDLWTNFAFNVLTPKQSGPWLYAAALWRQLGAGLAALALAGFASWCSSREREDRLAALALGGALAAMSWAIPNKEARYAIPLLPLVYAALGRGLELAAARLGREGLPKAALFAAALLLAPWSASAAALRYLATEPSARTEVPWALGARLESEVPPGGCVGWRQGDVSFPIAEPLFRYEPASVLGAPTFRFFVRRPVKELREGSDDGVACAPAVVVVPREGPDGPRWSGGPLARVERGGRIVAEVFADHVR